MYLENGVHYNIDENSSSGYMHAYLHLYLPEDMFYDVCGSKFRLLDDYKELYRMNKRFMINSINYDGLTFGKGFGEIVFSFTYDNEMLDHANDIKWFNGIIMKLVDDMYKLCIMHTLNGEEESNSSR